MAQTPQAIDAKVVLLGAAGVGKTCVIGRCVSDGFDEEMPATIGACYSPKLVVVGITKVNLQIWDTAGHERFRSLAPMYYRGAICALLVYSIVDEGTFSEVKSWANEIKQQTEALPKLFVVGNKSDLDGQRSVTTKRGEGIAAELDACFSEVSAKTGNGIDELFIRVAEEVVKKMKDLAGSNALNAPGKSVLEDDTGRKKKKGCC
jgi:small GTP-binding protein